MLLSSSVFKRTAFSPQQHGFRSALISAATMIRAVLMFNRVHVLAHKLCHLDAVSKRQVFHTFKKLFFCSIIQQQFFFFESGTLLLQRIYCLGKEEQSFSCACPFFTKNVLYPFLALLYFQKQSTKLMCMPSYEGQRNFRGETHQRAVK